MNKLKYILCLTVMLLCLTPAMANEEGGKVEYTNAEGTEQIQVAGGFVEVLRNNVSLCIERQ